MPSSPGASSSSGTRSTRRSTPDPSGHGHEAGARARGHRSPPARRGGSDRACGRPRPRRAEGAACARARRPRPVSAPVSTREPPRRGDPSPRRMSPTVSIVVPVYNEAESLPELATRIREAMETAGYDFEVWFVDDGSADGSWAAIEALHAQDGRFAGVRFRKNYGKSAALAAGFARVRGRYVATLDADLQDDPAELPAMVARLEAGADLVSGW